METNESTSRGGDVVGDLRELTEKMRGEWSIAPGGALEAFLKEIDAIASRLSQQGGTDARSGVPWQVVQDFLTALDQHNDTPSDDHDRVMDSARRVKRARSALETETQRAHATASPTPTADRVSVPREATPEMQRAYFAVIDRNMPRVEKEAGFGRHENMKLAYRAMLAAAPAPSPAGESRAVVLPDGVALLDRLPHVYAVASDGMDEEGNQLFTIHDKPVPLADNWSLIDPYADDMSDHIVKPEVAELLRLNPWLSPTTGDAREGQGDG